MALRKLKESDLDREVKELAGSRWLMILSMMAACSFKSCSSFFFLSSSMFFLSSLRMEKCCAKRAVDELKEGIISFYSNYFLDGLEEFLASPKSF